MEAVGCHWVTSPLPTALTNRRIRSHQVSCRDPCTGDTCHDRVSAWSGARWRAEIGCQVAGGRWPGGCSRTAMGASKERRCLGSGAEASGSCAQGCSPRLQRVRSGQGLRYSRPVGMHRESSGRAKFLTRAVREGREENLSEGSREPSQANPPLENPLVGAEESEDAVPAATGSAAEVEVAASRAIGLGGKKGTVLGAVALITGTSVGAGILALPAETAPAGFVPSAVVLGVCWAFLTLEALLLAEVNVALLVQQPRDETGQTMAHSEVVSLQTMAESTLGPMGGFLVGSTYLFLSYTLLVAYISKTAEVLSFVSGAPTWLGGAAFTIGFGAILYRGGTKTADVINQVMTAALLGVFGFLVLGGMAIADWTELERSDWTAVPQMVPVVFLSLVYHDLVPVLCAYLGGELRAIRRALVLGSLVPLGMFLAWDAVALSLSRAAGFEDPLQVLMRSGGAGVAAILAVFALLATATSFLGSVLSLAEFGMEQLGALFTSAEKNLRADRQAGQLGTSSKSFPDSEERGAWEDLTSGAMSSSFQYRSSGQSEPASSALGPYAASQRRTEAKVVALSQEWEPAEPPFAESFWWQTLGNRETAERLLRDKTAQLRGWTAGSVQLVGRWAGLALVEIMRERGTRDGGAEGTNKSWEIPIGRENLRAASYVTALVPPLVVAMCNPDAFFAATEAAGAYFMTTLYGIFPPAMAWSLRQAQAASSSPSAADRPRSEVPGGGLALAGLGMCASAVIVSQVMLDTALISSGAPTEVVLAATEDSPIDDAPSLISAACTDPAPHLIG